MTYFLVTDGHSSLAGSTTPLIKKANRQEFTDAANLLQRVRTMANEADTALDAAKSEAVQQGRAEGMAAAAIEIETALRGFSEAVEQIAQHHAEQVADAAYAATTAIIGELEDTELVARLVSQVLASRKEQQGLAIHVAPALQPRISACLDDTGQLAVIANPELGFGECHVMTPNGRIVASLPVQLAVLRERWGIERNGDES
jgi:flagellar biosynthesis/type III secretory pathway protein FliH